MPRATRDILDTLRLSAADASRLMRQLQRRQQPAERERRGAFRVQMEALEGITMVAMHPGGTRQAFRVLPYDLGAGGAGVMHGNFIHPGTVVLLEILDVQGQPQSVRGRVAWCTHVGGRVHGVGVRFDQQIDLTRFSEEAAAVAAAAKATPAALTGTVLYVDAEAAGRDAARQALTTLGLRMIACSRMGDAAPMARDLAANAVLLRTDASEATVGHLRQAVPGIPVCIVVEDNGVADASPAQPDVITLGWPLDIADLHGVLAAHLPSAESTQGEHHSTLGSDATLRPLIAAFARRVEEQVRRIAELTDSAKYVMAARDCCAALVSQASDYGYPALAAALRRLLIRLHEPAEREANLARCQELARRIGSGVPQSFNPQRACA